MKIVVSVFGLLLTEGNLKIPKPYLSSVGNTFRKRGWLKNIMMQAVLLNFGKFYLLLAYKLTVHLIGLRDCLYTLVYIYFFKRS